MPSSGRWRGVRIDIVGRIDLKGDIGGKLLTALNKLFVEKYGDRINIREFQAPDVVLHSKIVMIDERLVTIPSVNLNNRSFFHDLENGMMVLDPPSMPECSRSTTTMSPIRSRSRPR